MKASEAALGKQIFMPTGLTEFDNLMGSGLPLSCIVEFFGRESLGKSTLALQCVAAAQKLGKECLFSDTEYQFTPEYATSLGVDCEKLDFTQFRLAEDTFDAIEEWCGTHKNGLIVLDSMGGVLPREAAEKTAEGKSIGLQSRLMAAHCRKMIGLLAESGNGYIVVNHEVLNISTGAVGSSGGQKLSYHKRFSVRLTSTFGKAISRTSDGGKRVKPISAELKKEKSMDTREGRKAELSFEAGKGFVNEVTEVRRGRPKNSLITS